MSRLQAAKHCRGFTSTGEGMQTRGSKSEEELPKPREMEKPGRMKKATNTRGRK